MANPNEQDVMTAYGEDHTDFTLEDYSQKAVSLVKTLDKSGPRPDLIEKIEQMRIEMDKQLSIKNDQTVAPVVAKKSAFNSFFQMFQKKLPEKKFLQQIPSEEPEQIELSEEKKQRILAKMEFLRGETNAKLEEKKKRIAEKIEIMNQEKKDQLEKRKQLVKNQVESENTIGSPEWILKRRSEKTTLAIECCKSKSFTSANEKELWIKSNVSARFLYEEILKAEYLASVNLDYAPFETTKLRYAYKEDFNLLENLTEFLYIAAKRGSL